MVQEESPKPPLVFVHGWGFHNGLWRGVADRLADHEACHIELGFLRGGPAGDSRLAENAIYIGHSFGLIWLLKHAPRPLRGLVSVAGFDCFHAHVDAAQIEQMSRGLERNPKAQMAHFWKSCGTTKFAAREDFDIAALRGGLVWLAAWDERRALRDLDVPVLALAAEDDQIVPLAMSRAIWSDRDLRLRPEGGHALPLNAPQWCADEIDDFVSRIIS